MVRRSLPGILAAFLWLVARGLPAQAPGEESTRVKARSHTLVGELVRIDLARRTVVVKITGREPREYEIAIDDATRISSGGRVRRIEDLRAGERVLATCVDDESGRHRARVLKIGPSRHAAPAPSPTPATPAPPGP